MFKTDTKSLEKLSFLFNEKEISNLKKLFQYLRSQNLFNIQGSQIDEAINGLDTIGQMKLDGRVYAFNVYDSISDRESGCLGGVELYLRQGDLLRDYYIPPTRDYTYSTEDASKFLIKRNQKVIYTGDISDDVGFLGLKSEHFDEVDEDDCISLSVLDCINRELFQHQGIEVIVLDSLI